ncbi:hypothetical protein PQG44_06445 [Aquirufa sp. LEPPI-3A]|uniref:hypothetical protein n=1 Tax=Aquirufa regiilacus TaxID=3024868 RepID=UPI0028DD44D2|nr:hypothetical protein [Aquirufa sp. LEPPI-3A]MDT8887307.1 hypothetical protein [Aquirufa sp. LEPPI-3A]
MPASIPISVHEKKWFLKLIHEVYGIHLVDAYACQQFSEALLNQSRISISYNTLRRLFGIIKGSNQASRFTLDSISKSLGYPDFANFQLAVNQFEVDFLNDVLILNRLQIQHDDELILRIIGDFQLATWEEVYQLKSIVDLCIDVKNFDLLKSIFETSFDLHKEEIGWKLYVAFQSIFVQSKQGNQAVIDFVAQLMPTNEMAQRILLQLFVDEDALTGYYGRWLQAVSVDQVEDMELFKQLMQVQLAVLQQQIPLANELLDHCNALLASKRISYHPILKGRLAAWNLILKDDRKICNQLFEGMLTVKDQLFFIVFFYRLQELFGRDITLIDLMENYQFDELRTTFTFPEKQNLNVFYLLKARYWLLKNDKTQMAQSLAKFNPVYKYSCLYAWVDEQWKYLSAKL